MEGNSERLKQSEKEGKKEESVREGEREKGVGDRGEGEAMRIAKEERERK